MTTNPLLEEALTALEPFANYRGSDQYIASDAPDDGRCAGVSFMAGHYRRARTAAAKLRAVIEGGGEPNRRADLRAVAEAFGFEPDNHHNALGCPYCNPQGLAFAPSPPAAGADEELLIELAAWNRCGPSRPIGQHGLDLMRRCADALSRARPPATTGPYTSAEPVMISAENEHVSLDAGVERLPAIWRLEALGGGNGWQARGARRAWLAAAGHLERLLRESARPEPIPMVLHCPKCGLQHIDGPDPDFIVNVDTGETWSNPPHRSHRCRCGHIWRPADVATTGVAAIETRGKNDSPILATTATSGEAVINAAREVEKRWRERAGRGKAPLMHAMRLLTEALAALRLTPSPQPASKLSDADGDVIEQAIEVVFNGGDGGSDELIRAVYAHFIDCECEEDAAHLLAMYPDRFDPKPAETATGREGE